MPSDKHRARACYVLRLIIATNLVCGSSKRLFFLGLSAISGSELNADIADVIEWNDEKYLSCIAPAVKRYRHRPSPATVHSVYTDSRQGKLNHFPSALKYY